jgi:hypothetical protein
LHGFAGGGTEVRPPLANLRDLAAGFPVIWAAPLPKRLIRHPLRGLPKVSSKEYPAPRTQRIGSRSRPVDNALRRRPMWTSTARSVTSTELPPNALQKVVGEKRRSQAARANIRAAGIRLASDGRRARAHPSGLVVELKVAQDFLPRAESMIIGSIRVASSARNRLQISGPDMPDDIQSRMTRSGGAPASFRTASSPLSTLSTT